MPAPEAFVDAIEFRGVGGIGEFFLKSGWGPVRRVRIGRVRVKEERLIAVRVQPRKRDLVHSLGIGAAVMGIGPVALDYGPLLQVIEPAIETGNAARKR